MYRRDGRGEGERKGEREGILDLLVWRFKVGWVIWLFSLNVFFVFVFLL